MSSHLSSPFYILQKRRSTYVSSTVYVPSMMNPSLFSINPSLIDLALSLSAPLYSLPHSRDKGPTLQWRAWWNKPETPWDKDKG